MIPKTTPNNSPIPKTTPNNSPAVSGGNPKNAASLRKTPLRLIPPAALAAEARAMETGADKYGPYNWSKTGVTASTYYDAAMRHLMHWFTGQDIDPESGVSHLAHVRACMAIIIDAEAQGILTDDRPKTASFPAGFPPTAPAVPPPA